MKSDFISISKLTKMLNESFSNELPTDPQVTLEDIRMMQGQQQVVTFITSLGQEEDETES